MPPTLVKMPFRSAYGDSQYLDISRWVPGGDIYEQREQGVPGIPSPFQPSFGIWGDLYNTFAVQKDAFTGQDIEGVNTDDLALIKDFARKMIPNIPLVPGSYAWERRQVANKLQQGYEIGKVEGIEGDVLKAVYTGSPYGANYSPGEAWLYGFGVKLRPQNIHTNRLLKEFEYTQQRREINRLYSDARTDLDRGRIDFDELQNIFNEADKDSLQLEAEWQAYNTLLSQASLRSYQREDRERQRVAQRTEREGRVTGGLIEGEDVPYTKEDPATRINPLTGEPYVEEGLLGVLQRRANEELSSNQEGLLKILKKRRLNLAEGGDPVSRRRYSLGSLIRLVGKEAIEPLLKNLQLKMDRVGYHGTRAPQFKSFTMGSQYNKDGSPIVMGSGDPSSYMGIHFSNTEDIATKFAANPSEVEARSNLGWLKSRGKKISSEKGVPRVIIAEADVQNPFKFKDEGELRNFTFKHNLFDSKFGENSNQLIKDKLDNTAIDLKTEVLELLGKELSFDELKNILLTNRDYKTFESLINEFEDEASLIKGLMNTDKVVSKLREMYKENEKFRIDFNLTLFQGGRLPAEELNVLANSLGSESRKLLQEKGHDGMEYPNEIEGGTAFAVFDPDDVRLVDEKFIEDNIYIDESIEGRQGYAIGSLVSKVVRFVSPTLKALAEKAPSHLRGKQIPEWANKHGNREELKFLGLDEFIEANPKATPMEVVEGIKGNQVTVSENIRMDSMEDPVKFRRTAPDTDPLDGSSLWAHWADNYRDGLKQGDEYTIKELLDFANDRYVFNPYQQVRTRSEPFTSIDDLESYLKQIDDSLSDIDDVIEYLAKENYRQNPYEMLKPIGGTGGYEGRGEKTFLFGNENDGWKIFVDGKEIHTGRDLTRGETEAKIRLQQALDLYPDKGFAEYKGYTDAPLPGGENYREVSYIWDNASQTHNLSHIDDDTQIAHALIRDRKLADGTLSLHVDEFQSDLRTAGFDDVEGFQMSPKERRETLRKLEDFFKDNENYQFVIERENPSLYPPQGIIDTTNDDAKFISFKQFEAGAEKAIPVLKRIEDSGASVDEFFRIIKPILDEGSIPHYPYVVEDTWHQMVIKKLLAQAVEEGKTALSISTSAPIKMRYGIDVFDPYIEAYETLYDRKVPSFMKKLANQYGGKFEKGGLDSKDIWRDSTTLDILNAEKSELDELLTQANIIRITPEIREKILSEGISSFRYGGLVVKL